MKLEVSPYDSERFGIKVGRCENFHLDDWPAILSSCKREEFRLLVLRVSTDELDALQAVLQAGGVFCETMVRYRRNLSKSEPLDWKEGYSLREACPDDLDGLAAVSRQAFHDYPSHYQADEKLKQFSSSDIYCSWLSNMVVENGGKRRIVVVEKEGDLMGFGVTEINAANEGIGLLRGVLPGAQSLGMGISIVRDSINWSKEMKAKRYLCSCQITNKITQLQLSKLGMKYHDSFYTIHYWA
jgi:hypothetical protein